MPFVFPQIGQPRQVLGKVQMIVGHFQQGRSQRSRIGECPIDLQDQIGDLLAQVLVAEEKTDAILLVDHLVVVCFGALRDDDPVQYVFVDEGHVGIALGGIDDHGDGHSQTLDRTREVVGIVVDAKTHPLPVPVEQVDKKQMLVFEIPVDRSFRRFDPFGQFAEGELLEPEFVDQQDGLLKDASTQFRLLRIAQEQTGVDLE